MGNKSKTPTSKSNIYKQEEKGRNMPKEGKMKPDLCLREEEHDFRTKTKRKANKKVYHSFLSRKIDCYCKVMVSVDGSHTSHHMGNYGDTEEEREKDEDPLETSDSSRVPSSQEILDLSQENLASDLDDSFQGYHGESDNRRKIQCKKLKRKKC